MKRQMIVFRILAAALITPITLISLAGCASMKKRNTVPADRIYDVQVIGMPNVRMVVNYLSPNYKLIEMDVKGAPEAPAFKGGEVKMLVISGGGGNGAYGAGILCGWTKAGTRPDFQIVTGVSTGALTGTCAFLGPKYDDTLKRMYTTYSDADIARPNPPLFSLLMGESMASNKPLARILDEMITMDILNAVADEHAKGRRFYVATTNLDAKRPVVWDMGRIASVRTPEALSFYKKVILASAAIPIVFPPEMFKVEHGVDEYEELHVDGGISTQVFGYSIAREYITGASEKGEVFVIRNGYIVSSPKPVVPNLAAIGGESINGLIDAQAAGDLIRLLAFCKKDGVGYHATFIPAEFSAPRKSEFDTNYMNALFDFGYELAASGKEWEAMEKLMSEYR